MGKRMNLIETCSHKAIYIVAITLSSIMLLCSATSCAKTDKQASNAIADYTVVQVDQGSNPKDYYEFTSVEHVSLSSVSSESSFTEGVYSIGHLGNGDSVIWLSSDDGQGYDDRLYIYIRDDVSSISIYSWVSKLQEEAVPHSLFAEE